MLFHIKVSLQPLVVVHKRQRLQDHEDRTAGPPVKKLKNMDLEMIFCQKDIQSDGTEIETVTDNTGFETLVEPVNVFRQSVNHHNKGIIMH